MNDEQSENISHYIHGPHLPKSIPTIIIMKFYKYGIDFLNHCIVLHLNNIIIFEINNWESSGIIL